jgi:hypothetical protein
VSKSLPIRGSAASQLRAAIDSNSIACNPARIIRRQARHHRSDVVRRCHALQGPHCAVAERSPSGSNKAAVLRKVTEDYLRREGLDIKLDHGVDNLAMAMSVFLSRLGELRTNVLTANPDGLPHFT